MELSPPKISPLPGMIILMSAALTFSSCKNKSSSQASSRPGAWSGSSLGLSVVAGDSSAAGGKTALHASLRDKAVAVAVCADTAANCSVREVSFTPARLVASGSEGLTFVSVGEFDLKATGQLSVFARMADGGLLCADFGTAESAAGPVVVSAKGEPALCNAADPSTLGNGPLRAFLSDAGKQDFGAATAVSVSDQWVPNPEGVKLSADERDLIRRTNEARATAGLQPLVVSGQLMALARSWAQSVASRMIANEHSPSGVAENACCSPPGPHSAAEALGIWKYNVDANSRINSREARYIGVGSAMDAYGNFHWFQQFL